jgi:hypothetical protein
VTFPLKGIPASGDTQYNNSLFTTPTLSNGPHNLTVTHGGDINHAPLAVKGFYVTNTTPTSSSSPSPTDTSSPKPPSTSPTRVAQGATKAIAGGVGAAVFLLVVLAAVWLWHKRRQRQRRSMQDTSFNAYLPASSSSVQLSSASSESGYIARAGKRSASRTRETSERWPSLPRIKGANMTSLPVQVLRHEDSGLRLESASMPPEIVEIPPRYTPV